MRKQCRGAFRANAGKKKTEENAAGPEVAADVFVIFEDLRRRCLKTKSQTTDN